ncbi:MAG: ATP-dependent Clp protease proteolytic subunit [Opitutales bacterium]|nr:ATP-dependent Clp protease proteolytic subunit [Opitutales bacterium]
MKTSCLKLLALLAVAPFACAQEEPAKVVPTENVATVSKTENPVPAEQAVPAANPADEKAVPVKPQQPLPTEKDLANINARLLRAQADLMQMRAALMRQESAMRLMDLDFQTEELTAKQRLADARLKAELSESAAETARLKSQTSLQGAKLALESYGNNRLWDAREIEARIASGRRENEMAQMQLDAMRVVYGNAARGIAKAQPMQLDEPFVDDVLYVSDRRIDMNGPVTMDMAKYICDRLAFFDNQDPKKPIFVVIDSSPGGSVFAGYLMLKAVESCRAPVHVLVKSYAASMAAVFTTLAPHSYCLENAIILHHQPSSSMKGNMTVMKESYDLTKMWTGNIFNRVCEKVGVTYDEFVADMYAHFQSGDWLVFGKEAQERKWVDHVAKYVVETGSQVKPSVNKKDLTPAMTYDLPEIRDEQGRVYLQLPPLESGDAWWLTDPRGMYRESK